MVRVLVLVLVRVRVRVSIALELPRLQAASELVRELTLERRARQARLPRR